MIETKAQRDEGTEGQSVPTLLLLSTEHPELGTLGRQRVCLGAMPTMLIQVNLDFGKSRDFRRAAWASVAVSNPQFVRPEN